MNGNLHCVFYLQILKHTKYEHLKFTQKLTQLTQNCITNVALSARTDNHMILYSKLTRTGDH